MIETYRISRNRPVGSRLPFTRLVILGGDKIDDETQGASAARDEYRATLEAHGIRPGELPAEDEAGAARDYSDDTDDFVLHYYMGVGAADSHDAPDE